MLTVLGWRYWAGGRLGEVRVVTREGVEAVAVGSNCWAGCGDLYKLGCRGSLALVNEKGKAGGASADRVCADRACADRACADGACTGGACWDGACTGGACTDGACTDGARADRGCADGGCADGGCGDGTCTDKVVVPYG